MPGLTEEDLGHSLYEYAENRLSLSIAEAEQEIEAAGAKNREAGLLSIQEGSPILLILRTTRLSDGTPFEFVQSAYRADRYKFIHTMRRV
ncbi:GntR family transcriptional regulator [Mycobacteroides abscessus subsp. abscessus]|nr:GntR family transcriptional regulator [Mycobacteroides abscessus subsp. abscessus]